MQEGKYVWGDLWELADCYILNGTDQCEYLIPANLPVGQRILTAHADYFDRRNVYVIPKTFATLNQTAKDYLHV